MIDKRYYEKLGGFAYLLGELRKKLGREQTDVLVNDAVTLCKGTDFELPFLLAVWLGLRTSEIIGLTWDCLDGDTLPRCKERVATRLRRRERCLRVAAALSFQKSHVSRSGTNSMIVPSGTGSQGSPSKALPCFVQMSAGLLRRGSTST